MQDWVFSLELELKYVEVKLQAGKNLDFCARKKSSQIEQTHARFANA